jgi:hypothetical protein
MLSARAAKFAEIVAAARGLDAEFRAAKGGTLVALRAAKGWASVAHCRRRSPPAETRHVDR